MWLTTRTASLSTTQEVSPARSLLSSSTVGPRGFIAITYVFESSGVVDKVDSVSDG